MDKKSGKKIYGVLGYPAKHSLSPAMHNAAFAELKIDAEYKIFEVEPENLESFILSLSKDNICGLNVTIPYKEAVLKYLKWQSPEVRFTEACNTIVVKDKNFIEGWNTDGVGFHRHLTTELNFNIPGKQVVVLGAGGAAKAVTDQLARHKAKGIEIYDIDKSRSAKLSEKLNKEFVNCISTYVSSVEELDIENTDLLVNATPVGMKKNDPCLIDGDKLHKKLLVYDLVYNPPETKLLSLARKKGARVSNGLGMLLYQGIRSFEIWTDKKAPPEVMRQALNEEIKKL